MNKSHVQPHRPSQQVQRPQTSAPTPPTPVSDPAAAPVEAVAEVVEPVDALDTMLDTMPLDYKAFLANVVHQTNVGRITPAEADNSLYESYRHADEAGRAQMRAALVKVRQIADRLGQNLGTFDQLDNASRAQQ